MLCPGDDLPHVGRGRVSRLAPAPRGREGVEAWRRGESIHGGRRLTEEAGLVLELAEADDWRTCARALTPRWSDYARS
jgi:hypothetical protein